VGGFLILVVIHGVVEWPLCIVRLVEIAALQADALKIPQRAALLRLN